MERRRRTAKPLVIAQTERLLLREFQRTDWREVHEYASDPQVVRFMSWGPNTEEETRGFILRSIAY
jgi:ribosomal-protein-alanine N-acetyltransferase